VNIYLTLQTAPKIRDFINGIWMEWFVFMKLLDFFRLNKITPSISRNIEISFSVENSNELDIFLLTEKEIPICRECKTGEFRQDIYKYLLIRKQLDIKKTSLLFVFSV
jgi:hypothetical protein